MENFAELKQMALQYVFTPMHPWNALTSPGGLNIFTEGKGCRVNDLNGNMYLDFWGTV